jgi:hypothetical protein
MCIYVNYVRYVVNKNNLHPAPPNFTFYSLYFPFYIYIQAASMKKYFLLVCLILGIIKSNAQSSTTTLDVVGWNIEWFGASFESPTNDDLQRENVKAIIRYLNADIYGLVEIVDTAQVRRLMDSLGSSYSYVISDFCSNASAPGTAAWRNGQKLMFLYKNAIFSNVKTRGLMRTSATAVSNWATGRLPFLMNADATVNGTTKNINFILIHGKAGSTSSDYIRRRDGAQELKDTLDAQYPNSINIIFGDFNDALNQTISTGSGPETSYQPIVVDSTDNDHYKSITLPLAYAGQTTMINFPNVIDNHVVSNEMMPYYIQQSAQIRTDVTNVVPDYVSAHNTSDHYPVFSKYDLAGIISGLPVVPPAEFGISVYPNPFFGTLVIKANRNINGASARILNLQGQVLRSITIPSMIAGSTYTPFIPGLEKGVYVLEILNRQTRTVFKLTHL